MSASFADTITTSIGNFLLGIKSTYPMIQGFGIGLPPEHRDDPLLSEEENAVRAERAMTFLIFAKPRLTQEQEIEVQQLIAKKFIRFLDAPDLKLHDK